MGFVGARYSLKFGSEQLQSVILHLQSPSAQAYTFFTIVLFLIFKPRILGVRVGDFLVEWCFLENNLWNLAVQTLAQLAHYVAILPYNMP